MKAPGFLEIRYYIKYSDLLFGFKGKHLGRALVDLELNQWYHFKIEKRSSGQPDNKCSFTTHLNFNQIFEQVINCGSYSATETELYAGCWNPLCKSASGLVDSMRFVWL